MQKEIHDLKTFSLTNENVCYHKCLVFARWKYTGGTLLWLVLYQSSKIVVEFILVALGKATSCNITITSKVLRRQGCIVVGRVIALSELLEWARLMNGLTLICVVHLVVQFRVRCGLLHFVLLLCHVWFVRISNLGSVTKPFVFIILVVEVRIINIATLFNGPRSARRRRAFYESRRLSQTTELWGSLSHS